MNKKKYYLIYQVTNNVNGKIYIGMHETNDLEDDYMGSGLALNRAKEKYGLENFTFKVLMYLQNYEEMQLLEHCVVTPEFCAREDVYNIKEGGDGGWDYVNLSSDYRIGSEKRKIVRTKYLSTLTDEDRLYHGMKISQGINRRISNMSAEEREIFRKQNSKKAKLGFSTAFLGKHHTKETCQKISQTKQTNPQIGEKNGMFRKHWYHDVNCLSCLPFAEGEQPKDWIQGKLIDEKHKNIWIQAGKTTMTGSIAIYNPQTNELKFIRPGQPIPPGFEKRGRPLTNEEKLRMSKTFKNPEYINQKIEFLRPRYSYYLEFGFDMMKAKFDYPYSFPNFSSSCKKYLPEYQKNKRYNIIAKKNGSI